MRHVMFAIGVWLGLTASGLSALEIEERKRYPGTSDAILRILSTADLAAFEPIILRFQTERPDIAIDYVVASSADVFAAIKDGEDFDLVISSAMDLQFQLANDGLAKPYISDATSVLPTWARWRDLVFAFTSEPAVTVISTARFAGLRLPTTRQELIAVLRENPERFAGAIGTYDVRVSGLGYLFATQEARSSDAFWRLSEVMGRLNPQLYCCSGQMIDDVSQGRLAIAYNVLGSYAAQRLEAPEAQGMQILELEDYANVMLRTALIASTSNAEAAAGAFLDVLLREGLREDRGQWVLPPLRSQADDDALSFGPIRLGPALMVYLDPLNRRAFVESWESAMEQQN